MPKKPSQPVAAEMPALDADAWTADEAAGSSLVARLTAEFLGTYVFMFLGLGTIVFGVFFAQNYAGGLTSAFGWGVVLAALIVVAGRISGAHFNPAVTIGAWTAGRLPGRDVVPYVLVQTAGAIGAGATLLGLIAGSPNVGFDAGNGVGAGDYMAAVSIGYGADHSPASFPLEYCIIIEAIVTALLVAVVLGATSRRAPKGSAPFVIGFGLGILILVAAPFTNGSLNPARASATALFAFTTTTDTSVEAASNWAIGQLWVWWVVALLAGAFVGLLFRAFGPEEDLVALVAVDEKK